MRPTVAAADCRRCLPRLASRGPAAAGRRAMEHIPATPIGDRLQLTVSFDYLGVDDCLLNHCALYVGLI